MLDIEGEKVVGRKKVGGWKKRTPKYMMHKKVGIKLSCKSQNHCLRQ
jgi:hypothetical protein